MLPYFPRPYMEEILYSIIARYHYYSGNHAYKDTLVDVFCSNSIIPTVEFPTNLEVLSSRLSSEQYSVDNIINCYTLLPFYSPFLPVERRQELSNLMAKGSGQGIYTKIGFVAGSVCKKDGLEYCPKCIEENHNNYGEAYFHRIHQLQGIKVCTTHKCKLKLYPVTKRHASRISFIRLDYRLADMSVEYVKDDFVAAKLHQIAEQAFLIKDYLKEFDRKKLQAQYFTMLGENGLLTQGGRVRQKDLCGEFKTYYGELLLNELDSNYSKDEGWNWLSDIIWKPHKVSHPIRHILLILFLSRTVKEFAQYIPTQKSEPFGLGQWPCLNKASSHYKKKVITNCNVTQDSKTKQPVGTFTCSCGFVYSRRGPDSSEEDLYHIGRTKKFGYVWEQRLTNLINQNKMSLRALAREMGCDPKTVVNMAHQMGLESKIQSKMQPKQIIRNKSTELKGLYHTQSSLKSKKQPRFKVDWAQRDADVAHDVEVICETILSNVPPQRVTKSLIEKKIAKSGIRHYLNKMPKTKLLIDNQTESVKKFQIRRVHYISRELLKKNQEVREWEVMRLAGLKQNSSPEVIAAIQQYIEM